MARRRRGLVTELTRGRCRLTKSTSLRGIRTLHITYFGLREPLVQTQVLPYLRELAARGVSVFLLTFEPVRWDQREWRERLRAEGIEWFASRYHKRPTLPATLFDVVTGAWRAIGIVRRHGIGIIHARSAVPALMGAIARRFVPVKLLFDIRGLIAEEYADTGHWRRGGFLHRTTRAAEEKLRRSSDGCIVLTQRVCEELFAGERRPIEVIPCCIEPARFTGVDPATRGRIRSALGVQDRLVIVYVGALGEMYLPDRMAEFFAAARAIDPRAFALILTQSPGAIIDEHLRAQRLSPGIDYHIGSAPPGEIPGFLAAADAAISLVMPSYSKIASSPTKFAEYLASGLPVVSTRGIGDLDEQIERHRVGVLLDGFGTCDYERAFGELVELLRDPELPRRCRELAARGYDLHAIGGERYARIYGRLGSSS